MLQCPRRIILLTKNTDTDGQVTAHNSTDNNEPTIELETETMVIE